MTLKGFTTLINFKEKAALFLILTAAIIFRYWKIQSVFSFDYDQQVPAEAAYNFFINHRITLVGQELSFPGFFLGPIHNWIQFIPYGICNLNPQCIPYFFSFLGLSTTVILYFITKEILSKKLAIITSTIYALSFTTVQSEGGVNSNYFLFLVSLLVWYCLYRYFQGKKLYLILASLITGMAVVNFNPLFIFTAIAIFTTVIIWQKPGLKLIMVCVILFLANYLPLIIFNLRHENILILNLVNFLNQNTGDTNLISQIFFLSKIVLFPYLTNYLFSSTNLLLLITTAALIILGSIEIVRMKKKYMNYLIIAILINLFGLGFYKGHISDYYFQQSIFPSLILIALSLKKNLIFFLIFLTIFSYYNIEKSLKFFSQINFEIKGQVVEFILKDSINRTFNVYYDFPPGFNTGYSYLFKLSERHPQENGNNLYIVSLISAKDQDFSSYYLIFPQKQIYIKTIGLIQVISIKNLNQFK